MNKSWSKYGGSRGGNEAIVNAGEWTCQSCGQFQPEETVVFNHYHDGSYLRVCAMCAGNDCEKLKKRLQTR